MTVRLTTDAIWINLTSDLRHFIHRRVSDDHIADDLLQETFVRVHRNIAALQEAERVAAWAYQIARNMVHDHHRGTANSIVRLADAEPVDDNGDHEPQFGRVWLDEMIRTLPDGYREAVQMAEIDERSQQYVADQLGVSL